MRESTLAEMQTGFTSLTDDELKVARLGLVGEPLEDIFCILTMSEKRVQQLWHTMRCELRSALMDEAMRASEASSPAPPLVPETHQETENTGPTGPDSLSVGTSRRCAP